MIYVSHFIIYIIIYSLPFIVSDLALLQDCPYMANQVNLVNLVDLVTLAYLVSLAELAGPVTKYYMYIKGSCPRQLTQDILFNKSPSLIETILHTDTLLTLYLSTKSSYLFHAFV